MAVITGLKASFTSFKINDAPSSLRPNIGVYGTSDILNGGELLENELVYTFLITGLQNHTIASIDVKSLLLTEDGGLNTSKNMKLSITNYGAEYSGNFITSDVTKTIITTSFNQIEEQEENQKVIELHVKMNSTNSCYYALQSLVINLQDIEYNIQVSFTGPISGRTVSKISTAALLISRGAVNVTFSKDPTSTFDSSTDTIEGRMYLRSDGIYVDQYQYGTVAEATDIKSGIVKLKHTFEVDADGGIVAPTESGIAATPQMVYNAIATLKQYADDLVDGITAPDLYIEEEQIITDSETETSSVGIVKKHLTDEVILSEDFEATNENKIYIKWLEIA